MTEISTDKLIKNTFKNIDQILNNTNNISELSKSSKEQIYIGKDNINKTIKSMEEINVEVDETVRIIKKLDSNSQEIGQKGHR